MKIAPDPLPSNMSLVLAPFPNQVKFDRRKLWLHSPLYPLNFFAPAYPLHFPRNSECAFPSWFFIWLHIKAFHKQSYQKMKFSTLLFTIWNSRSCLKFLPPFYHCFSHIMFLLYSTTFLIYKALFVFCDLIYEKYV